jgi:hypothetical protein
MIFAGGALVGHEVALESSLGVTFAGFLLAVLGRILASVADG